MYLILGLGNPGSEYDRTRHNAGYMVVDALARKHSIKISQHKYNSLYGNGKIDHFRVVVSKPLTYMNESGKAAKAILNALGIPLKNVIVVHDDIDIPLGKIKIKHEGGDAGQRGVRSMIHTFHTDQFTRVRVGIDRPENKDDIVDYVLSPFKEEEWEQFVNVIECAVQRVEKTLQDLSDRDTEEERHRDERL